MKQKKCYGRTPEQIKAVRPLKDGVIADFTATQLMLKNIIKKVGLNGLRYLKNKKFYHRKILID
jgi:actin-like ATPase involved in cell morphogenesis